MKNFYILVGNIASGKSTWLKDKEGVIISKDDLRKQFAKSIEKEYIFEDYLEKIIHSIVEESVYGYCHLGAENIYIDETNMAVNTREMYIEIASDYGYNVVAVIFPDYGEDIHVNRRLKDNHGTQNDGCTEDIWKEVYRIKRDKYEVPTLAEGFSELIHIKKEES